MPRIRTVKPDLFFDEELAALGPEIQLFFIGLFTQADKAGRMEDRPLKLHASLFPYNRKFDPEKALSDLCPKFITRYEVQGKKYIQINSFTKHQRPHHTEADSNIPPPSNNGELTVKEPLETAGVRKGKEGKGMEGCAEAPKPDLAADPVTIVMRFPCVARKGQSDEWPLTEAKLREYQDTYRGVDVEGECRRARQWCIDNAANRKTYGGMPAFLSRWLSKAQDQPRRNGAAELGPKSSQKLSYL